MRGFFRWVGVLLLLLTLSGCGERRENTPLAVVVEKIEVVSVHEGERLTRTYTKNGKMKTILQYLRWVNPKFKADCDPERIPGDDYRITLTLSDGETEVYHQKTNGYMQKGDGRWENIDPEKGVMLYEILSQMAGDEN